MFRNDSPGYKREQLLLQKQTIETGFNKIDAKQRICEPKSFELRLSMVPIYSVTLFLLVIRELGYTLPRFFSRRSHCSEDQL